MFLVQILLPPAQECPPPMRLRTNYLIPFFVPLNHHGKRRFIYVKEEDYNLWEKENEKKYCIIKPSFHKFV